MNYLLLLADESSPWFREFLHSDNLGLVVPVLFIIGSFAYGIARSVMRHRERIAKIEHGIDPDAKIH
jgi:hypothetical protein